MIKYSPGDIMLVYRVCAKRELDKIVSDKSFASVGSKCTDNETNTHHYLPDTFYMHFFSNVENVLHVNNSLKRYVCTYDIDEGLLEAFCGLGCYRKCENSREKENVVEYAIPSAMIKLENLVSIDELKDYVRSFEYKKNNGFSSLSKRIYERGKVKAIEKK